MNWRKINMKIRCGFASKAWARSSSPSSSSFMLYGIHLTYEEEYLKQEIIDEYYNSAELSRRRTRYWYDFMDWLTTDEFCGKYKVDVAVDYDCGDVYIGASYYDLRDDETGKEFKDRATNAIENIITSRGLKELKIGILPEVISN
jgi:hypothetical protein